MSLKDIYIELLQYPDSIKTYRNLQKLYHQAGMSAEADAFAYLLQKRFKEIPTLHVDNSPAHEKQPIDN